MLMRAADDKMLRQSRPKRSWWCHISVGHAVLKDCKPGREKEMYVTVFQRPSVPHGTAVFAKAKKKKQNISNGLGLSEIKAH